jgi:2-keto-4-pentenoate hydratase/2-oxohepta-3-ene-1,7-dioic acid hydratase in catechol pathway
MINPVKPKRGSKYGLTRSLHFELEVAFIIKHIVVGGGSSGGGSCGGGMVGRPMTAEEARGRIFGKVLMNDWRDHDLQRWE